MDTSPSPAPWHALLAPLPPSATVRRAPVAPPGRAADAIAGWEQLTVALSAGAAGLRHLLVTLDADGRVVSASDTVLHRAAGAGMAHHHASVGGRFEPDGRFLGTRWRGAGAEGAGDAAPSVESEPSTPSADDVAALRALVAEIVRRAPPR